MKLKLFMIVAFVSLFYLLLNNAEGKEVCEGDFLYNNIAPKTSYNVSKTLCHDKYIVGYSYELKMPLWSAERLTEDAVNADLRRTGKFHNDTLVPSKYRTTYSDYTNSGYSRGHLTPSADAGTKKDQYDTFSMSNIVPQLQANNGGVWKAIEAHTRNLAIKYDNVYVVTGAVFKGRIEHNLNIPEFMYKSVTINKIDSTCVYVSKNDDSQSYEILSLTAFEDKFNINTNPHNDNDCISIIYEI